MRSIGIGSRAIDFMIARITDPVRKTFGKYLYEHGTIIAGLAQSRMEIDQARLLVLSAALQVRPLFPSFPTRELTAVGLQIDKVRAKGAMKDIGMAKVRLPFPHLLSINRLTFLRCAGCCSPNGQRCHRSSYASSWCRRNLSCVFHSSPKTLLLMFLNRTEDTPLAALWAGVRTLRYADGPDEVCPHSPFPLFPVEHDLTKLEQ